MGYGYITYIVAQFETNLVVKLGYCSLPFIVLRRWVAFSLATQGDGVAHKSRLVDRVDENLQRICGWNIGG